MIKLFIPENQLYLSYKKFSVFYIMKESLIRIYIVIYISYIVYGPLWYVFLIKNKQFKYKPKNIYGNLRHMIYFSYVSFLYTIYFFKYPNAETFILALLMTCLSFILFLLLFQKSDHYSKGIIEHFIFILPFMFYYKYFKIDLKKYKATNKTYLTICIILIYSLIYKKLYGFN